MILAAILIAVGLVAGMIATQLWDLRLSGVIVVPLFAIYTLYDLLSVPILLGSVAFAYASIVLVTRRTLLFGRRLLYVAVLLGALGPLAGVFLLTAWGVGSPAIELYAVGSILPGIAAYNLYRVDRERRIDDVIASVSAYVGLVVLGVGLVSMTTASWLATEPAFLFAPEADVAQLRGVADVATGIEPTVSSVLGVLFVLFGLGASMFVEDVWNVRLLGIIALPLLALFAVANPIVIGLYALGIVVTYACIEFIHRQTLLYGRVLLSAAVLVATVSAIPVAVVTTAVPGHQLLFTALLAGIGAFNCHRLAPRQRAQSIRLSAGLLAALILGLALLVGAPPVPGGLATLVLATVVAGLPALVTALSLETNRHRNESLRFDEVIA